MSKASKRPGREARDVHAAIREAAAELRGLPAGGMSDADAQPELAALMRSAREAIEAALPSCFDFCGRRYFVRSRLLVQFDIFDSPAALAPLVCGMSASSDEFGHMPGH